MSIEINGVWYDVPREVESAGRDAILAFIANIEAQTLTSEAPE